MEIKIYDYGDISNNSWNVHNCPQCGIAAGGDEKNIKKIYIRDMVNRHVRLNKNDTLFADKYYLSRKTPDEILMDDIYHHHLILCQLNWQP